MRERENCLDQPKKENIDITMVEKEWERGTCWQTNHQREYRRIGRGGGENFAGEIDHQRKAIAYNQRPKAFLWQPIVPDVNTEANFLTIFKLPMREINSPMREIHSPMREIKSPIREINSPMRKINCPENCDEQKRSPDNMTFSAF